MAITSATLSTVATGIGVASSLIGGATAIASGQYQNSVAKLNAKIAERNAQAAIDRSHKEAQEQDRLTAQELGGQLAAQGASGLSTGSKSNLLTRKTAAELGKQDRIRVREAGERDALNFRIDAMNQRQAGISAVAGGRAGLLSSFLKAGSSLVSGAERSRKLKSTLKPQSLLT